MSLGRVLQVAMHKSAEPGLMKSSLASWVGRSVTLRDSRFWRTFSGVDSASGQMVSQRTALQLSACWACVRLIAETLATLPLGLYEESNGKKSVARQHPLHYVISTQPNADQTPVEFWENALVSLLINGNSYVVPTWQKREVTNLEFLLPQWVEPPRRLKSGAIGYSYTDSQGERHEATDDEVMHTRGFGFDPLQGLSPISQGRQVFGSALAADESAGKIFANGMKLGGVLSTEQILKKEQREELRSDMAAQFAGSVNTGKTMVLEAGMKYQAVSMTPEDAQMLQTRAFNVEEICRWFRVPPWMVGHTANSTSWGTGMEQQMLGFLAFTLLPWMQRIEQSIERRLLAPEQRRRFFVRFNPEGLLRADSAARAAFYSAMTQNGIYSRDDCREKENLPPVGGNAGLLTVQSNLTLLDSLGDASEGEKAKQALADWLRLPSLGD
ncbi:phage portal protein [Pseudomonas sp. RIT-PI-AD]|uniref:phage portal protein n=1 Tax=Pseudomonas sp. RIT-PI-AD TaxID=3035294 RepID=UPI0021D8F197|nr:phage portal protein [Pseudomonas sp. RIT-PI-AD]